MESKVVDKTILTGPLTAPCVRTFKSVNLMLRCGRSNESYCTMLSCGTVVMLYKVVLKPWPKRVTSRQLAITCDSVGL